MQIQVDQTRLLNELQTLATFTDAEPDNEGTVVTRVVFSADDLRARTWLERISHRRGLRQSATTTLATSSFAGSAPIPSVRRSHRLSHRCDPPRR